MSTQALDRIPHLDRLSRDLDTMAEFREKNLAGYTRRSFTPLYRTAREWIVKQMQTAGLIVKVDAAGNLVGRLNGIEYLPPLVVGSHTDTVEGGGRFDGVVGVLGGLEAIRSLRELGISLRHPLELIDFLAEEPTNFGVSTVGSRGLVGTLTPEMLTLTDTTGLTLARALVEMGGRPEDVATETRSPGSVAAYLELHIEQGAVLDRSGAHLAAVTSIAGIRRYRVLCRGRPDHAGTTPMDMRRDAFTAASEFVLAVESICHAREGIVGTVGHVAVEPNFSNVIPGQVELTVDLRSIDALLINITGKCIEEAIGKIAVARHITMDIEKLSESLPVHVETRVLQIVEQACSETTLHVLRLASGAGHDANQMAKLAPVGMIFVPSRDGRSHCPEEFTDIQDIGRGVQALARAILKLDAAF